MFAGIVLAADSSLNLSLYAMSSRACGSSTTGRQVLHDAGALESLTGQQLNRRSCSMSETGFFPNQMYSPTLYADAVGAADAAPQQAITGGKIAIFLL